MNLGATKNLLRSSAQLVSALQNVRMVHYKRAVMCGPSHFVVGDLINPWMGGVVDKDKAWEQWKTLKRALQDADVDVLTMDQAEGLPDMVFCCNSGVVLGKNVYLSHFRHSIRQPEREHYLKWFEKHGFTVHGKNDYDYFEGGGDSFFARPDLLLAGYGPRTDKEVYEKVAKIGSFRTLLCELVHPKFYHLDTCLFPLNEKQIVWFPDAFSQKTKDELTKEFECISVSEEEAFKFACNALPVPHSKTVIAPPGSPELKNKLESLGYKYIEVDMSEFMKSGGACQCLVLKLPDA